MRFKNKVVVITGSTSGIGKLCAECFAREGAAVMLTGTNEERLHKAVDAIVAEGGRTEGMIADIRNYAEIEKVCDRAAEAFGKIDILVACAGGASSRVFGVSKEFHEYPIELLDWGIDVNLKGPLYFARACMAHMVKQKSGVVILLGSITGEEGTDNAVDYAAAKSALMNGALKSLAQCGAPHGIRVCTVSPGPVLTREAMGKMKTLLGRAAETQEIVDLIMFMASEQAGFITGSNVMIDGGRSSMLPS